MDKADDLDMRLFISWDWHMHLTTPYTNKEMDEQIANRAQYASDRVSVNGLKIYLDGTPQGYQVPFIEPYSDGSGEHGLGKFTQEELTDLVASFDKQGVSMMMHSVGEGGTRMALNAIEETRKRNGNPGMRHSIAHLVWVYPEDVPRFASVPGVTAEVSPAVSYPDNVFTAYLPLVGQERIDRMFPAGSLFRAGAKPGYGTDWLTVLSPNPWPIMQNLVTRINPDSPELGELGKNETITIEQAIQMFTINGAYTVMAEDRLGSIEKGKAADMIVLDRNLLQTKPMQIQDTKVLKTILAGAVVYDSSKDEAPDLIDEEAYEEAGRVIH
jgi:predicted amidohydrolase YtcJ